MDIPFSFSFVVSKTIGFSQIRNSSAIIGGVQERKIINNEESFNNTIAAAGAKVISPGSTGGDPKKNVALSTQVKPVTST
jgi:hypothetical protein